jgi:hypothetical protein
MIRFLVVENFNQSSGLFVGAAFHIDAIAQLA